MKFSERRVVEQEDVKYLGCWVVRSINPDELTLAKFRQQPANQCHVSRF